MSEDNGKDSNYLIAGPLILSFGTVGAIAKGVFIFVAVAAVPVGLGLTVYGTYGPARRAKRGGRERVGNVCMLLTTAAYVAALYAWLGGIGIAKALCFIGAPIGLVLPFALTARRVPESANPAPQ
jgi:hypothetical protein